MRACVRVYAINSTWTKSHIPSLSLGLRGGTRDRNRAVSDTTRHCRTLQAMVLLGSFLSFAYLGVLSFVLYAFGDDRACAGDYYSTSVFRGSPAAPPGSGGRAMLHIPDFEHAGTFDIRRVIVAYVSLAIFAAVLDVRNVQFSRLAGASVAAYQRCAAAFAVSLLVPSFDAQGLAVSAFCALSAYSLMAALEYAWSEKALVPRASRVPILACAASLLIAAWSAPVYRIASAEGRGWDRVMPWFHQLSILCIALGDIARLCELWVCEGVWQGRSASALYASRRAVCFFAEAGAAVLATLYCVA